MSSRQPESWDSSRASSKANRSASTSTPDSGPIRKWTAPTRASPRARLSSNTRSMMLNAIESSCMVCCNYIDSIFRYRLKSGASEMSAAAATTAANAATSFNKLPPVELIRLLPFFFLNCNCTDAFQGKAQRQIRCLIDRSRDRSAQTHLPIFTTEVFRLATDHHRARSLRTHRAY